MLRFKSFILEKSMFSAMNRTEWEKVKARTTDFRTDILKNAIKAGEPVSSVNGEDLKIKNTKNNLDAITAFVDNTEKDFKLELENGTIISSLKIGKSALFGGQGQGQGMTGQTADAESLQCIYIAAMLGEGSSKPFSHFTVETLADYKDKVDVDVPFERYSVLDASWHESGYVTAKALIDKKYVSKEHVIHRGSKTMNAIYAKKSKARKNEGLPPMQNDKWNPGDIWAVKRGVDVNQRISDQSQALCNQTTLENFLSRDIVGISLKKINSLKLKAKVSEYNIEKKSLDTHKFSGVSLETTAGKGIWTSKYGFAYFDGNGKLDIRAPNLFTPLNMEIIQKGARGGRTGYTQITYSAKTHLGVDLPSNTMLKENAKKLASKNPPKLLVDNFYKMVKKVHPTYTKEEHEMGISQKAGQAHFIHAILGVTHIAYAIMNASQVAKRNDFISEIVNVAGAKTNDSSAYVKVAAS